MLGLLAATSAPLTRLRGRKERPHFEDRNHRQEAEEEQEQHEEEPERAGISGDVPERRAEAAPCRRQKVPVQARHDDHEPLEPHPDVDDDRDDEESWYAGPDTLEPERLRSDDVAEDEQGVGPPVWTRHPVPHHEAF